MDTSPPPQPPYGTLIELARKGAHLSIQAAADRAGVSKATWIDNVRGYRKRGGGWEPVNPKPETIADMACAVTITPERLANEGGRPDAADVLGEIVRQKDAAAAADVLAVAVGPVRSDPFLRREPPVIDGDGDEIDDADEASPDLRPWRQQVIREAYEAIGLLPRLGPGDVPEPGDVPGAREVLTSWPGELIFAEKHEALAWNSTVMTLRRKINTLAKLRRIWAWADEEEKRRTETALAAGGYPRIHVAGTAAQASS